MKYLTGYASQTEFLSGLAHIAIWSETEIKLSIIAGSLPTLRPLLNYVYAIPMVSTHTAAGRRRTKQEMYRLKGSKRSTSRYPPADNDGHSDGEIGKRLGNSFYVGTGRKEDAETGDSDDAGSQRHILTEARLEVFKETQYEVKSERGTIGPIDPDRA
jgi:hypothetical protein